jgi:hypothetical protein
MRLVSIVSRLGAITVLGAALAGCGAAGFVSHGERVLRVGERDFAISAPKVPAGDAVLRVKNAGPDDHELLVVRADQGPLPLRGDGLTVDEEASSARRPVCSSPGTPKPSASSLSTSSPAGTCSSAT